jgi:tetratricopeptide (TPR) repeat protein
VFDLRVEDHPRPVEELKRLVGLARAYTLMNEGDEHVAAQRYDEALQAYAEAERLVPENDEFIFWHAVALVSIDRLRDALPVFRRAFLMNPSWWLLIPRLVEVGLLPDDPEVIEAIQAMGPTPAVLPDGGEAPDGAAAGSPDPDRR